MALCNCPCNCGAQPMGDLALGQAAEGAGAATGASVSGLSPLRSIGIGVATGLTVWFLTRMLDGRGRKPARRRR